MRQAIGAVAILCVSFAHGPAHAQPVVDPAAERFLQTAWAVPGPTGGCEGSQFAFDFVRDKDGYVHRRTIEDRAGEGIRFLSEAFSGFELANGDLRVTSQSEEYPVVITYLYRPMREGSLRLWGHVMRDLDGGAEEIWIADGLQRLSPQGSPLERPEPTPLLVPCPARGPLFDEALLKSLNGIWVAETNGKACQPGADAFMFSLDRPVPRAGRTAYGAVDEGEAYLIALEQQADGIKIVWEYMDTSDAVVVPQADGSLRQTAFLGQASDVRMTRCPIP